MQKYTEQIRGKLVEVMYRESDIKSNCKRCKKIISSNFEKLKENYLERGNYCPQCSAETAKRAYENYQTRNKMSAPSV